MHLSYKNVSIQSLVGLIVARAGVSYEGSEVILKTLCDRKFVFYHKGSCCEDSRIKRVDGDSKYLLGVPILSIQESFSEEHPSWFSRVDCSRDFQWTFHKFETVRGVFVVSWLGQLANSPYGGTPKFMEVFN